MAVTNRTDEFMQFRSEAIPIPRGVEMRSVGPLGNRRSAFTTGSDAETTGLLDPERGPDSQASEGPEPEYMELKREISQNMSEIQSNMKKLRELYKQQLQPHFDSSDIEQKINILTQKIKHVFKECEEGVRAIGSPKFAVREPGKEEKKEDHLLRSNVQKSLATQLMKISYDFKRQQKVFVQEVRNQMEHGNSVFDIGKFEEDPDDERARQIEVELLEKGFSDEEIAEVMLEEDMLRERGEGIEAILHSIMEIHDMFKDMHQMVIDQGTLFDRIEYNVEVTAAELKQSNVELKKAEEYQKKSKLTMCIMFMVLLVGGFGLALIVKFML